jgi:hypothetical protein
MNRAGTLVKPVAVRAKQFGDDHEGDEFGQRLPPHIAQSSACAELVSL